MRTICSTHVQEYQNKNLSEILEIFVDRKHHRIFRILKYFLGYFLKKKQICRGKLKVGFFELFANFTMLEPRTRSNFQKRYRLSERLLCEVEAVCSLCL